MAIYLDYAAATPVDQHVLTAMLPFYTENFYNPSALYGPAQEVTRHLNQARQNIAGELGSKPSEIIFTAGGTEANNLALRGIMQKYPKSSLVISAIEHDSVREPAKQYRTNVAKSNELGIISAAAVQKAVTEQTVLVSVMYANNEIGSVQPIRQISQVLSSIKKERIKAGNKLPLYLHTDAAQAGNYLDMHVYRLGVDLMTINGGKIYGPKQSGALYVRSGLELEPIITGGGQERGYRSGTENIAGAVGLAEALRLSSLMRKEESNRITALRDNLAEAIRRDFPDAMINGSLKNRLPNNLHVTLPGTDNERLLMALDMKGVYAAAGSACSAGNEEPSHVLNAIGLDKNKIHSSIRFSLGRQTTDRDISDTVQALKAVLA